MSWNISSECVSIIILCIIWVYSWQENSLPSPKNRMFQFCFLITFCSMVSNIAATLLLYHYNHVPILLSMVVNTIYFIATPMMGAAYFFYSTLTIYENRSGVRRIVLPMLIPMAVYVAVVLLNPLTGHIFSIDPLLGYQRGPYVDATYWVFYLYCVACVVLVCVQHSRISRSAYRILLIFPIMASLVIIVQQIFPTYMLTGSAATCALLLLYLYLQNKQISVDYLTEIPNRQEFLRMLALKLHTQQDRRFTVIILSLKGFKLVNHKFGQQNGDLFLCAICDYLKLVTRGNRLYRFSGDEFAILIEREGIVAVRALIDPIHARMAEPWNVGQCRWTFASAFAIVQYPYSADTMDGLISGIEASLAQAKKSGMGYCHCTPELLDANKRKIQILELLKEQIAADSFEVYYQPILQVDTNRFSAAESLLRMNNTPIGNITPDEFIPIAEDSGLIVEITYQVLRKVCVFIGGLLANGVEVEAINVNFSACQFSTDNSGDTVLKIIRESGIPPEKIKIEITESVLMDNLVEVMRFMDTLGEAGVRFVLDDFGTGYSNVSTVANVSFHTIKMDKSLIWSSVLSAQAAIIVRHLVSAFRDLRTDVLAEGIETAAQNNFAIGSGCNYIQGFLYARPMPAAQAAAMMGTEPVLFRDEAPPVARQQAISEPMSTG